MMLLCLLLFILFQTSGGPAAWLFLIVQGCIFLCLSILIYGNNARFERARRLIFAFLCFKGINSHLIKIVALKASKRFMSSSGAKMSLSGQKVSIFCGQCRIFDIFPKIGVCVPIFEI